MVAAVATGELACLINSSQYTCPYACMCLLMCMNALKPTRALEQSHTYTQVTPVTHTWQAGRLASKQALPPLTQQCLESNAFVFHGGPIGAHREHDAGQELHLLQSSTTVLESVGSGTAHCDGRVHHLICNTPSHMSNTPSHMSTSNQNLSVVNTLLVPWILFLLYVLPTNLIISPVH